MRVSALYFTITALLLPVGPSSAYAKPKLQAVSGFTFSAPDAVSRGVTVKWPSVPNASRYNFDLIDRSGAHLLTKTSKSRSQTIDASLITEDERYTIRVRALSSGNHSSSRLTTKQFAYTTALPTSEFFGKVT